MTLDQDKICSKCGSSDIYREYVPAGALEFPANYRGLKESKRANGNATEHDRLRYHCRDCGFEWDTLTKDHSNDPQTTN